MKRIFIFILTIIICNFCSIALSEEKKVINFELEEFISEVVRSNPSVKEFRLKWLISDRKARAAWGNFEPELVTNYGMTDQERQNNNLQTVSQGGNSIFIEDNVEYGVGIEEKTPTGGKARIGYSMNRLENSLNTNVEGAFVKEYESFTGITFEQPLLKGAWYGSPMADIKMSEKERTIAFHNFRKQLMTAIAQAESAYWDLVFSQEQYFMAEKSVEIAEKIVVDNKERVKIGKMSELDILEAEAGLAVRLSSLSEAEQKRLDAVKRLKLLLSDDFIDNKLMINAVDKLIAPEPEENTMPKISGYYLDYILNRQPDYMAQQKEVEKEKIRVNFYKDQRLPELNFKGSYGYNGLGENENKSIQKIEKEEYSSWSVSLEMRIPLFMGVKKRNELSAANLQKKLAEQKLQSTYYEIDKTLEILIRQIEIFKSQIRNAKTMVDFKKRLLDVELTRMENGKSDTRKVYEIEEEYIQAKDKELEVILKYKDSLMQLAFLKGSLLRDRGLEYMDNGEIVLTSIVKDERQNKSWYCYFSKSERESSISDQKIISKNIKKISIVPEKIQNKVSAPIEIPEKSQRNKIFSLNVIKNNIKTDVLPPPHEKLISDKKMNAFNTEENKNDGYKKMINRETAEILSIDEGILETKEINLDNNINERLIMAPIDSTEIINGLLPDRLLEQNAVNDDDHPDILADHKISEPEADNFGIYKEESGLVKKADSMINDLKVYYNENRF